MIEEPVRERHITSSPAAPGEAMTSAVQDQAHLIIPCVQSDPRNPAEYAAQPGNPVRPQATRAILGHEGRLTEIKVSGSMRSMTGAETFCAIRSYLATATRHGIAWLDALTRAAAGTPWIPGTT